LIEPTEFGVSILTRGVAASAALRVGGGLRRNLAGHASGSRWAASQGVPVRRHAGLAGTCRRRCRRRLLDDALLLDARGFALRSRCAGSYRTPASPSG
jgi:hypothetical protein